MLFHILTAGTCKACRLVARGDGTNSMYQIMYQPHEIPSTTVLIVASLARSHCSFVSRHEVAWSGPQSPQSWRIRYSSMEDCQLSTKNTREACTPSLYHHITYSARLHYYPSVYSYWQSLPSSQDFTEMSTTLYLGPHNNGHDSSKRFATIFGLLFQMYAP